ncbi:radical SAM protein [Microcoleus sp. C2C3]|uniref:radical SAM protein n=1 Tax=unclassified Microcoleus TaxID=2642155 RepID=UPI002FCE9D36
MFGYKLTQSEPDIVPNQPHLNEFNADAEQTSSAQVEATKKAKEIRNVKQAYHLERRLFQ